MKLKYSPPVNVIPADIQRLTLCLRQF